MKIALIGYGKMGKTIEEVALHRDHSVVLKIDIDNIASLTKENLQQCDVAIEFTGPHSARSNILNCFEAAVPVVCGSTGWLNEWDKVISTCNEKNGSFLYASNFSVGVNIFFEVNKKLAQLMKHQKTYDVSIEETHHTQKRDAPSGTAITLAEEILLNVNTKKKWVNNQTENAEELSISSKRIDPTSGTHSVKYSSVIDDIEIIHTAHNRQGFALGAVLAAEFLYNKKGVYTMKDVLNIIS